MAYDRYDDRGRRSEMRGRSFDSDRDDRGFLERARDEVTSWFGDERDDYRRDRDDRDDSRFSQQGSPRSLSSDRDFDRFERSPRYRDEGYRRPYTGRSGSRSGFGDDGYRPMTGDYGRSSEFDRDYGSRQSHDRDESYGRSQSFDRGSSQRSGATATSLHDRDYSNWRNRQISEFDNDYDEFRRENSSRFENEFSTWREGRQAKKALASQLTEHMDVVGSDNEPVGKIDHIKRDRIILTKSDSPDGRHHVIGCARFDRVEDGKLILDQTASQIQQSFDEQKRSRALFEDERPDDTGPHMLNRSFSGTY